MASDVGIGCARHGIAGAWRTNGIRCDSDSTCVDGADLTARKPRPYVLSQSIVADLTNRAQIVVVAAPNATLTVTLTARVSSMDSAAGPQCSASVLSVTRQGRFHRGVAYTVALLLSSRQISTIEITVNDSMNDTTCTSTLPVTESSDSSGC